MRYIIRLLRVFWRNKPKKTVRRDMRKKWYEAYDPAGHARSVACARRSVWEAESELLLTKVRSIRFRALKSLSSIAPAGNDPAVASSGYRRGLTS
jgi:hypothetical protein